MATGAIAPAPPAAEQQQQPPLPPTMRALALTAPHCVEVVERATPKLILPSDAIVKTTLVAVCGSDLHAFCNREKGWQPGTIVGHEFVGVVVAVGAAVRSLRVGDRVVAAFTTSCGGECFYCRRGLTCRCCAPGGGRCFGWVPAAAQPGGGAADAAAGSADAAGGAGAAGGADGNGGAGGGNGDLEAAAEPPGLEGSQAQYVRVPLADGTLMVLPEDVGDEHALLLGDILSTAQFCVEQAAIQPGDAVAVVGCGPVGLLAVLAAKRAGAGAIVAVDGVAERRALALELGATAAVDAAAAGAAAAAVAAATGGRGVDASLELVGSVDALRLAFDLLRPGGTLSSIGVQTEAALPFTPGACYDKNVTFRSGRCPARRFMAQLLPLLQRGELGPVERVITHRLPLSKGDDAYVMFSARRDGVIKVVLDPSV